jgi:formamidopyrimidine-DNA glycosylase
MPEIIEIREYADLIRKNVVNKKGNKYKIYKGRYKKHDPFEGFKYLKKKLPLQIIDVKTKGKFLYFILDNNIFIFNTCGLSGGWCIKNNISHKLFFANHIQNSPYVKDIQKYLNIEFVLENNYSLLFYDMLSFGTLKVVKKYRRCRKKIKYDWSRRNGT